MKIKVDISNEHPTSKIPLGTKKLIKKACLTTLKAENFSDKAEVNVTFTDDNHIKEYNGQFRNIDKSTDVLSFPLGENGIYDINPETNRKMLGDVVISIDHAVAQAELFGHGLRREIGYLTVHSMLHLLGYDHVNNDEEKAVMRAKEEKILSKIRLRVKEN